MWSSTAVLYLLIVVRFSLAERKNEQQIKVESATA
jgi:hypothetical protein